MSKNAEKNKRIAKNTLVLYVRMLFLMAISLYTSRVILEALGVEDFGIYNVVGGFVALFGVLSRSMSSAASRFFNYEMGRGDIYKLGRVFSSTLLIHIFLALIIAILAELFGIWFVGNKMVIAPDRICAAKWLLQFSILNFTIHLLTVPYHAAIIAHERMNVFAYIGIYEGIVKLLICYLIMVSPIDRLVFYGILLVMVQSSVCLMNYFYCKRFFSECECHFVHDKEMLKEIFGFASWNMIGTSSVVLRNQGGNVLINLFGGPVVNAARAIANQVLHAVNSFVENFMVALRPQITKSYASGDWDYMTTLIEKGSRYSFYMMLLLCLPIFLNTDYLLHLWLKVVPDHTVLFVQLTLLFSMIESISGTLITAQLATGNIRNYQLVVGSFQILNIPISYILLKMGGVPETILYVAIVISLCSLAARLLMLRDLIKLKVRGFLTNVILNILIVSAFASIIPFWLSKQLPHSLMSFIILTIISILSSIVTILYFGCKRTERLLIFSKMEKIANIFIH